MSKADVEAGANFAAGTIKELCISGTGDDSLLFYMGMIGAHMGNIVAHIGKPATLAIMDTIREQIAASAMDQKTATSH